MGLGGKLPSLGPFTLGVNNRRPEQDLRTKEGDFLRSGVNVDVSSTGTIKRRSGYAQVLAGADCHSLYSSDARTAYFVDGSNLMRVDGLDIAPVVTAIKAGMAPGRHVSYATAGDSTYFTNDDTIGRIDSTGAHPLGCLPLSAEPDVASAGPGSLPPGVYQVCFAFLNAAGEQSGSTIPQSAVVSSGALNISRLPTAWPDGVTGLAVFMSPSNSDQLLHIRTLTAPQATLRLNTLPAYGGRCQTLLKTSMPAGNILRVSATGRLLVAKGSTLFYSDPFAYALTDPEGNYITFNQAITVLEVTEGGIYVVADKAYWLAGDVEGTSPVAVLPYGGVFGTGGSNPKESTVWWMSQRGLVIADAAGAVKNRQEVNVAIDPAPAGASLFRAQDGLQQVLTSMFNPGISGAAAHSYMDGEIVRKGTIV